MTWCDMCEKEVKGNGVVSNVVRWLIENIISGD